LDKGVWGTVTLLGRRYTGTGAKIGTGAGFLVSDGKICLICGEIEGLWFLGGANEPEDSRVLTGRTIGVNGLKSLFHFE
jgi:hypothetical protein